MYQAETHMKTKKLKTQLPKQKQVFVQFTLSPYSMFNQNKLFLKANDYSYLSFDAYILSTVLKYCN